MASKQEYQEAERVAQALLDNDFDATLQLRRGEDRWGGSFHDLVDSIYRERLARHKRYGAMSSNPAGKVNFVESYSDPSTGEKSWDVYLGSQNIGSIEKRTEWAGGSYSGHYVASDYDVSVSVWDDEGVDIVIEETITVDKDTTARQALAKAKQIVRDAAKKISHAHYGPLKSNPAGKAVKWKGRWRKKPIKTLTSLGDGDYTAASGQFYVTRTPRGLWAVHEVYIYDGFDPARDEDVYISEVAKGPSSTSRYQETETLTEAVDAINEWLIDEPMQGPLLDKAVRAVSAFSDWEDLKESLSRGYVPTLRPDNRGGNADKVLHAIEAWGYRAY